MNHESPKPRRRPYWTGRLHELLVSKLPGYVSNGRIQAQRIAKETGYTRYGVHIWMREDRLSRRAANALLEISRAARSENPELPEMTEADLYPFLFA